jgi:hypothetical protein
MNEMRVAIVGADSEGLLTAHHLAKLGITNVTMYGTPDTRTTIDCNEVLVDTSPSYFHTGYTAGDTDLLDELGIRTTTVEDPSVKDTKCSKYAGFYDRLMMLLFMLHSYVYSWMRYVGCVQGLYSGSMHQYLTTWGLGSLTQSPTFAACFKAQGGDRMHHMTAYHGFQHIRPGKGPGVQLGGCAGVGTKLLDRYAPIPTQITSVGHGGCCDTVNLCSEDGVVGTYNAAVVDTSVPHTPQSGIVDLTATTYFNLVWSSDVRATFDDRIYIPDARCGEFTAIRYWGVGCNGQYVYSGYGRLACGECVDYKRITAAHELSATKVYHKQTYDTNHGLTAGSVLAGGHIRLRKLQGRDNVWLMVPDHESVLQEVNSRAQTRAEQIHTRLSQRFAQC